MSFRNVVLGFVNLAGRILTDQLAWTYHLGQSNKPAIVVRYLGQLVIVDLTKLRTTWSAHSSSATENWTPNCFESPLVTLGVGLSCVEIQCGLPVRNNSANFIHGLFLILWTGSNGPSDSWSNRYFKLWKNYRRRRANGSRGELWLGRNVLSE